MMKNRYVLFTVIFLVIFFNSCVEPKVNNEVIQQSDDELVAEVKEAMHNCIGWVIEKNFDLLFSIISNDSSFLEVHPDNSIFVGFHEFKQMEKIWSSPDFKGVGHDIKDLKITLSKNKDVAWFYCILNDYNEWKGEPVNWENTRWTGVMENIDGNWVIQQQHFSFAQEY